MGQKVGRSRCPSAPPDGDDGEDMVIDPLPLSASVSPEAAAAAARPKLAPRPGPDARLSAPPRPSPPEEEGAAAAVMDVSVPAPPLQCTPLNDHQRLYHQTLVWRVHLQQQELQRSVAELTQMQTILGGPVPIQTVAEQAASVLVPLHSAPNPGWGQAAHLVPPPPGQPPPPAPPGQSPPPPPAEPPAPPPAIGSKSRGSACVPGPVLAAPVSKSACAAAQRQLQQHDMATEHADQTRSLVEALQAGLPRPPPPRPGGPARSSPPPPRPSAAPAQPCVPAREAPEGAPSEAAPPWKKARTGSPSVEAAAGPARAGLATAGAACSRCLRRLPSHGGMFCGRPEGAGSAVAVGCGAAICWRCMRRAPREQLGAIRASKPEMEALGAAAWWMHEGCMRLQDRAAFHAAMIDRCHGL
ncbi:unnamed protein product [Prorocentrum cordatum]|uniref:Uncharacterized protein n=1 Tax=Prorocentrum cordatum TaxID=2364126 RepID=A0ABN9T6R5_9DINO|nr:unnamed protein product [Polarella glacialis]